MCFKNENEHEKRLVNAWLQKNYFKRKTKFCDLRQSIYERMQCKFMAHIHTYAYIFRNIRLHTYLLMQNSLQNKHTKTKQNQNREKKTPCFLKSTQNKHTVNYCLNIWTYTQTNTHTHTLSTRNSVCAREWMGEQVCESEWMIMKRGNDTFFEGIKLFCKLLQSANTSRHK